MLRIVLGLVGLCLLQLPHMAVAQTAPAVVVEAVRKETIFDRVEALGTLRAQESVEITALVTEQIEKLHFEDGQSVAAGDIIVEMVRREELAALEEAKATFEEAAEQLRRARNLHRGGTLTEAMLSLRRREHNVARARVTAVEARIADRLIRAPFAGRMGIRMISPGARVQPGDMIARIIDDSVLKLDFSVPSTFLAKIQTGIEIVGRTRAYPGELFKGAIKSIDTVADPVTRSVLVRAIIPNPEQRLLPGLLMEVDLLLDNRDALLVSESGLIPFGTKTYVLVIQDREGQAHAERREVTIGTRLVGIVEILSGLREGEQVITEGTVKVRPGQQVTPRTEAFDRPAEPKPAPKRTEG